MEEKPKDKEETSNNQNLMAYFDEKFKLLERSITEQKDEVIKALNLKVEELNKKLKE